MNFFKTKPPNPVAIAKSLKDIFVALEKAPARNEKTCEEAARQLGVIKRELYGDGGEVEPNPEIGLQIAVEFYNNDLFSLIIPQLHKVDFEAKKDVALIFNSLLRKTKDGKTLGVDFFFFFFFFVSKLITGYSTTEIALNCGSMLRNACVQEPICKLILTAPNFYDFFVHISSVNFDVASDAFNTFKEVLSKHKNLSAEFLEKNYQQFFGEYTKLLTSQTYVVRIQSLKFLGELLLDRVNFNIMTKYIADSENLKLIMTLLRDKSKNIQFEAFHVFKVFVANPHKPAQVTNILIKNKKQMVAFLQNFQADNEEDQFNEEKAFLIKQVQSLPDQKLPTE